MVPNSAARMRVYEASKYIELSAAIREILLVMRYAAIKVRTDREVCTNLSLFENGGGRAMQPYVKICTTSTIFHTISNLALGSAKSSA